jgi:hypothetical protein
MMLAIAQVSDRDQRVAFARVQFAPGAVAWRMAVLPGAYRLPTTTRNRSPVIPNVTGVRVIGSPSAYTSIGRSLSK